MLHKPQISIVIATYNSKYLVKVLESIRMQNIDQKNIEILLVDGGSTDATLKIGRKYHCRIIKNPRIEPVYAKYLGLVHSHGKYILYLDHDEVIENSSSITKKIEILLNYRYVKAVVGSGYKNPKGFSKINNYVNDYGDPFSYYVYKLSRKDNFFVETMNLKYRRVNENENCVIYKLNIKKTLPPIELVQGGSMFDRDYIVNNYPGILKEYYSVPHLFIYICERFPYIAIIKNDPLLHYSSENLMKYLKKIDWRIKNNIYHYDTMGRAGFLGREKIQKEYSGYRKYLFIPYSLSVVLPLIDAIYLSLSRKDGAYLLHLPLCIYTSLSIIFHMGANIIGKKPVLKNYDNTVQIVDNETG